MASFRLLWLIWPSLSPPTKFSSASWQYFQNFINYESEYIYHNIDNIWPISALSIPLTIFGSHCLLDFFPCQYYYIFTALSLHCDLVGTNFLWGYYHNTPFTNSGFTGLQLHCLYLHPTTMRMGWDMSIENISLSDLINREREMAQSLSKVGWECDLSPRPN